MSDDRVKKSYGNTVKELKRNIADLKKEKSESYRLLGAARDELQILKLDVERQGEAIYELREVVGHQNNMLDEFRQLEFNKLNDMSATCDEKAPGNPPPLYRVITNGKRFAPQQSKDEGESWMPVQTWKRHSHGRTIVSAEFRVYRNAVRFIRKQYGMTANILPREWRAV